LQGFLNVFGWWHSLLSNTTYLCFRVVDLVMAPTKTQHHIC
jgi:hypothetical protein